MIKFIVLSFFLISNVNAKSAVSRMYFKHIMGHIHKNPSDYSSSLTTIQCAQSVKLIEDKEVSVPKGWFYVKVGEDMGYIRSDFLLEKRPSCFQQKHPEFFNALNLDLTDLYYWGRLYDQFEYEESLAQ